MPAISLVICAHNEGDFLRRLIKNSVGCYDELIVVHDGPDETNMRKFVEDAGGRFFERQREQQQEPHWPFAWGQAKHDWILRLDPDEFPSVKMKEWLQNFRKLPELEESISGYTCIWPLWNGRRKVSENWPTGRNFFFNKNRVRFFGLVEQVPIPDGHYEALDLVLEHQPNRKSYGFNIILFRKRAKQWRECIARSLLGRPTDLACWRWDSPQWPEIWEQVRREPWHTGFTRLTLETFRTMRQQLKSEGKIMFSAAFTGGLHHALFCFDYWKLRRRHKNKNHNCSCLTKH